MIGSRCLIIFILISFSVSILAGQELNQLKIVGKATRVAGEIVPGDKLDANKNRAALVSFITDLDVDMDFKPWNGAVGKITNPAIGRWNVYVSPDERVIDVHAEGFMPLKVVLGSFGINRINSGDVYHIKITGDMKTQEVPVVITCNQSGAKVIVDGEEMGSTVNKMLTINLKSGVQKIRLEKAEFVSQEINEDVSLTNNSFHFELVPGMPALVKITSDPPGAIVTIEGNVKMGVTPLETYYETGTYTIRLEQENYDTINEQITITEPDTEKHYTMTDIRATLTITTHPEATVTVNDQEFKGGVDSLVLLPKKVVLKVEQEYCESIVDTFMLQKGEIKTLEIFPIDISARLTIKTNPNAVVKFNDKNYEGGIDQMILMPQPISFIIEQEYCEKIEESYTLGKGENKVFELYPEDISASLTIQTYPKATVKFNGESYTGGVAGKKLLPQVLTIEVSMPKAEKETRIITLKSQAAETIEIYPEVQTGIIQVLCLPAGAKIELSGDAGEYYTAIGKETFTDVPIGFYRLKVTLNDYIPHEEEIHLTKDDIVKKSINLERANYIFEFINNTSSKIATMDYKITKDNKLLYSGKGKPEISFSEAGRYHIEISKGKDFRFSEDIIVQGNGKYEVNIKNQIAEAREKKKLRNKAFMSESFSYVNNSYYQTYPLYQLTYWDLKNSGSPGFKISPWIISEVFNAFSHSKKEIGKPYWDEKTIFMAFFEKASKLSPKLITHNFGYYSGGSFAGNFTYSKECYIIDIFSLNFGLMYKSDDNKSKLMLDVDCGFKMYGIEHAEKDGKTVYYFSDSGREIPFVKWAPGEISLKYENYLKGNAFIFIETGFWVFTNAGGPSAPEWRYESTGHPIQGYPDHPVFDGVISYISMGIKF